MAMQSLWPLLPSTVVAQKQPSAIHKQTGVAVFFQAYLWALKTEFPTQTLLISLGFI